MTKNYLPQMSTFVTHNKIMFKIEKDTFASHAQPKAFIFYAIGGANRVLLHEGFSHLRVFRARTAFSFKNAIFSITVKESRHFTLSVGKKK